MCVYVYSLIHIIMDEQNEQNEQNEQAEKVEKVLSTGDQMITPDNSLVHYENPILIRDINGPVKRQIMKVN